MKDELGTGAYYTIGHLTQFTGLTDRTIRKYISTGLLNGEKINGLWHFTPEQVDAFLSDPNVRPSILAKKNALVYDFMLDRKKADPEICLILDLPGADAQAVTESFCAAICQGDFHNLRFSSDYIDGSLRLILKGKPEEVLALVNQCHNP